MGQIQVHNWNKFTGRWSEIPKMAGVMHTMYSQLSAPLIVRQVQDLFTKIWAQNKLEHNENGNLIH